MPKVVYKFVADEAGLTTTLSKVSVQLDKVDKGAATAKETTADLGKQFGAAKEGASAFAAGLSRVSPELGALANSAAAALGILKSMATAAGPIGVALAAAAAVGAAAYAKFSGAVEAAEKKALVSSQEALKAQLGMVDSSIYANKALEANEKASLLRREGAWRDYARSVANLTAWFNPIAKAVVAELDKMDAAQADAVKQAEAARDRNIELAQSAMKVAEAKKEEEKATKTATAQAKKDETAALKLQADKYAEVQARFTEIDAARDKKSAELAAREKQRLQNAKKLQDMYNEGYIKSAEEQAAAAQATADIVATTGDGIVQIANNVAQYGEQSKGAQVAIALVTRAAALAQIAANTGAAIAQAELLAMQAAAATGPAAPVTFAGLSAAMQAQIIATAGLSTAAVLSAPIPTYHSGSGEVQAVLQTGEAVLNRATASAIGKDTINAMNRGDRGMGGAITANVVGHRTMDRWWVKSVSRIHSPTRAAIQKLDTGVRPGRRRRL